MASRVFKLVCGLALSCWSTISVGFLWGWTRLKLSWVLSASCRILTTTRITPSPSHETVTMTFPTHRHFMNLFFQGDWGWCHSMNCLFLSSSKWWPQVSSEVTIRYNKVSPPASKNAYDSEEMAFLTVLLTAVRLQGAHLEHTFEYSRSWMTWLTLPLLI